MVEFALPKNSRVQPGKVHKAKPGAKQPRAFKIYRYDPDEQQNPRVDTFEVDLAECGPMVLDALIKIKSEIDSTLTFRRSCREGICGSCSMNIDGQQHAGLHQGDRGHRGRRRDLPPAPHGGDPRPRRRFHRLLGAVRVDQALAADLQPPPDKERTQSVEERAKLDGLYECILCACCTTSCPSYWWNGDKYPGPGRAAAVLSLADRQPRRGHRRAAGSARGPLQALPLPHDHELRQHLPQGPQPGARRSPRSRKWWLSASCDLRRICEPWRRRNQRLRWVNNEA